MPGQRRSLEIANFITQVDKLCPSWIKEIINRPFRERMSEVIDRVKFTDIGETGLPPEILKKVLEFPKELTHVNRELISCGVDESALVQNFGNDVFYVQAWDNKTQEISQIFYLDLESQKAVDLKSLDPSINFINKMRDKSQVIDEKWEADEVGRRVFYPGDPEFGWATDQERFESLNLTSPAHEVGHITHRDVLMEQGKVKIIAIALKNWAEAFRGSISSKNKYYELQDAKVSQDELEISRAMVASMTNYQDDERGSSKERYATLFSLLFARHCKNNGVDLFRARSQTDTVLSVQDALHSSQL